MGSVALHLRHRALVVLAALLLALAVAPLSASAHSPRATASVVWSMSAGLADEGARPRAPSRGEGEPVVAFERPRPTRPGALSAGSSSQAPKRAFELPVTSHGRYRYLVHCALLC